MAARRNVNLFVSRKLYTGAILTLLSFGMLTRAQAQTPDPKNVRISDIKPLSKARASFTLEWNPAPKRNGQPNPSYTYSAPKCSITPFSGGVLRPGAYSGLRVIDFSGPRYGFVADCPCGLLLPGPISASTWGETPYDGRSKGYGLKPEEIPSPYRPSTKYPNYIKLPCA